MNTLNADSETSVPNFSECLVELSRLPWVDVMPFVREKRVHRGGWVIRYVEFQQGFEEEGWCEKGHMGYVTQGRLEVRFTNSAILAGEGDSVWIPAGAAYRHRAKVLTDFVHLVLFESHVPGAA
ncbi:MAG: phosrestin [Planctomycetaceae bacterium]|nr:hypothetical protein [Planctomycetales bacterium]MCB9921964.1 phosrestin [Planctomycetaceae bacterium]